MRRWKREGRQRTRLRPLFTGKAMIGSEHAFVPVRWVFGSGPALGASSERNRP